MWSRFIYYSSRDYRESMKSTVLFVVFLYQLCFIYDSSGNPGWTKNAIVEQISTNFTADSPIIMYTIIKKYNRTHTAFTGNCTLLEPIGDKFLFKMEVMTWRDGGWKRNYVTFENRDPCEQMRFMFGKPWIKILNAAHVRNECPYPKGYYELKNYYIDGTNQILVASGKYKVLVNAFIGKRMVFTLQIDATMEDRYSG